MDKEKCDFLRYRRQVVLPQVGEEGQKKLYGAKVLVVGAGGLGSPILYYLAAAGIGTLGIIDSDTVDISNLNRQILHWEKDIGRPKVLSAKEKLEQFNSGVKLNAYQLELTADKAVEIFTEYDIIVSAVDNIETRLLINEVCYKLIKPWIDGGVRGFSGVVTSYQPPKGPCYHCLHRNIKEGSKEVTPIIGTLPGVIGTLQAQEVIKLILSAGTLLTGRMLLYDALEASFDNIEFRPDPDCPVCG